ncbi:collagen alpha-1(X) chain-like [Lutra lutra]|uniref:collagen alpha-1(X) chain-like n=1 Tax=Lutra lutra TaxID=9657 RepID=UPI001FD23D96|nr:collagen alpha-1(X) chain-like [Lutra lutra]
MQPSVPQTAQRSEVGHTHPPAGSCGRGRRSLGPRRLPSAPTACTHRGGAGHPGGATLSRARVPRHEAHLTPHGRPPQVPSEGEDGASSSTRRLGPRSAPARAPEPPRVLGAGTGGGVSAAAAPYLAQALPAGLGGGGER